MPTWSIVAQAFNKEGRLLNGNTHSIKADTQRDAEQIAKSRQRFQVETAKVQVQFIKQLD